MSGCRGPAISDDFEIEAMLASEREHEEFVRMEEEELLDPSVEDYLASTEAMNTKSANAAVPSSHDSATVERLPVVISSPPAASAFNGDVGGGASLNGACFK